MKYILILILTCTESYAGGGILAEFDRIAAKEYKLHVYDCSNMSGELIMSIANEHDIETAIVRWDGKPYGHALVKVTLTDCGITVYLDPAQNLITDNLDRYCVQVIEVIPYDEFLDRMAKGSAGFAAEFTYYRDIQ
jgi:hypothetical protein